MFSLSALGNTSIHDGHSSFLTLAHLTILKSYNVVTAIKGKGKNSTNTSGIGWMLTGDERPPHSNFNVSDRISIKHCNKQNHITTDITSSTCVFPLTRKTPQIFNVKWKPCWRFTKPSHWMHCGRTTEIFTKMISVPRELCRCISLEPCFWVVLFLPFFLCSHPMPPFSSWAVWVMVEIKKLS